jgi:hypothetical protein
MDEDEWSYKIKRKCWEHPEELPIELSESTKDVKETAHLLKDFLEEETLPFKVLGEIEIDYSNKSVDMNLNERWGNAYITIPIMKRGFLRKPKYDKLEEKHYLKIRISLGKAKLSTWQEHAWSNGSIHRWYMEMEQIKAWKELLERFNSSFSSLKANFNEIRNPSAR